ncbi:MAG: peptidoglycan editing factor PgeF [Clostridiales bacterium]|nr:peptidoglycan editing factor PgeF [Clostridiales bacterium]
MGDFNAYFDSIHRGYTRVDAENGVTYFTAENLAQTGLVRHGFTSRLGGISKPPYDSLNLSWTRCVSVEETRKNVAIACDAMGIKKEDLVVVNGVHGVDVHKAVHGERGMGYESSYRPQVDATFDGLVTNEKTVCLNTIHADCTPVFLLDPAKKAIGLCHSGWRGTVMGMARNTIAAMEEHFGTDPKDLIAAIGPNIGKCCFEVSQDVVDAIRNGYPDDIVFYTPDEGVEGKYHADLVKLTAYDLYQKGIKAENVTIMGLCTCCEKELLYSFRRDGKQGGAMNSFLQLI